MQLLLGIFCFGCLAGSWSRFRSVVHPHFVFTLSWLYLLPFGVVVSPELPDFLLEAQPTHRLNAYYLTILGFLSVLFLATMYLPMARKNQQGALLKSLESARPFASLLGYVGLFLLGAQVGKQVYACGWSIPVWIEYSVGPRFGRPWSGGYIGGGDFIYTFLEGLFGVAGLALTFGMFFTRGGKRVLFCCGLLLTIGILICNGSRTPVAFTLLVVTFLWYQKTRDTFARFAGAAALMTVFVVVLSAMLYFRDDGFSSIKEKAAQVSEMRYDQDDNFFRLMKVLQVSDSPTATKWDAPYFLSAALFNPVPRFFWQGKPLLTEDFYGDWKEYYVTITYIGESIAMFGKVLGLAFAFLVGFCYYKILAFSYQFITRPLGLVLYLGTAFYIYSASRSIQNLGMNMLFILTVFTVFYWAQKAAAVQLSNVPPKRRRARMCSF